MRHLLFLTAAALVALVPSAAPAQAYGDPNALVASWYQTYLGRAPDPGMAGWVAQLNQGTAQDVVLSDILGSDEYYLRAGSTPQGFVTQLYNNILQRPPTAAELSYWVQRIYTTARPAIADALLTQNPGVWVSPSTVAGPPVVAPPPVVGVPPVVVSPRPGWERDRHADWDRHHDVHDYHRPDYQFHHEGHDEREHHR